jgi:hypothetical protein
MTSEYDTQRKRLNKQVTELRRVMADPNRFDEAMQKFFEVHAQLHSASVSDDTSWSFEDAIMDDLDETTFRRIPNNQDHSIAWCIWHIARIEDVTMNLLVADGDQVYLEGGWDTRLGAPLHDTANALDWEVMAELSQALDMHALRTYRQAVGKRTRQIVTTLLSEDLRQQVIPSRLQRVWEEGALIEAAQGIADYWGGRDIAGLLLMPASRHCLTHLNEALKLKHKRA